MTLNLPCAPRSTALALASAFFMLVGGSAAAATVTASAVYYVDSLQGSDVNNGLSATAAAGGAGPWRSLARLKRSEEHTSELQSR